MPPYRGSTTEEAANPLVAADLVSSLDSPAKSRGFHGGGGDGGGSFVVRVGGGRL